MNYGLQAFRAVACLAVFFMHALAYLELAYNLEIGKTLSFYGRYALLNFVEIFFALSGFFASKSVLSSTDTSLLAPLKTSSKRALRIYPTYWLSVGVAAIILLAFEAEVTVGDGKSFIRALYLSADGYYILRCEWTLCYTILFYLIASVFSNARLKKLFLPTMVFWYAAIILREIEKPQGNVVIMFQEKTAGYYCIAGDPAELLS